MKCALLLEQDVDFRSRTARTLRCLGYIVAPVQTPQEAFKAVQTACFDLIVTCEIEPSTDRRSFTGELKRSAPNTAIVLIDHNRIKDVESRPRSYAGVNAVLRRPVSLEALRRTIEYWLDCELQPAVFPVKRERRRVRAEHR